VEPPTRHRETAKPTSTPPAAWSLIRRAHQLRGDHGLALVIARLLHIARAVADTAILEGELSTLSG